MTIWTRSITLAASAIAGLTLFVACGDDGGGGGGGGGDTSCDPSFGQSQACGGALSGTWNYKSGCIADSFWDDARKACSSLAASNTATTTSGTLTFTGANYALSVQAVITGTLTLPATCVTAIGGCSGIPTALKTYYSSSTATCTASGSNCSCQVSVPFNKTDSGTFTTSGGIATLSGGEIYYYCIQGSVARYRGTTAYTADNDITYVLTQ
jgi:hypothetical protein